MSEQQIESTDSGRIRRVLPWLNLALAVGLVVAGLWFISSRIGLVAIGEVLAAANAGYVALALLVMLLTVALKAWRWQLLYAGTDAEVPYDAAFWATSLGQYVNLIVPFLRLGEIARIYSLNREVHSNTAQTIGTLVVEKVLDLIFFGLTILLVLPYIVLPEQLSNPGVSVVLVPLAALIVLYVFAFQTDRVVRLFRRIVTPLPDRLGNWLTRVGIAGLEGLAVLRSRRLSLLLVFVSLVIAGLSVLLPYLLFPALDLNLALVDAALIHIVVSVVAAPPSTPVKIGVFNGAAALVLWQLGIRDEPVIVSYSILFYLVVVLPQLLLGIIAAVRSRWSWNASLDAPMPDAT